PVLYSQDITPAARRGAQATLLQTLETTLRLAHPFVPFMTEEIWQQLPAEIRGTGETLMLQDFPVQETSRRDDEAVADVEWIKGVVTGTRNIRGEMNISFSREIPILFANGNESDQSRLERYRPLLQFLVKPESLTWLNAGDDVPVAATHLVGDMQVLVPMSGLIDKEAEIARLDKEIDRKTRERERAENKISNPNFVEKAPSDVVEKEKEKLAELTSALEQLQEQRSRVVTL
ncbi:MAG: class I tRNA ligase family protein, partial [Pseudomonadales bacterium]|nr:class I tRNA ligase family protein [Pseudomonadales bacterium]